ncbi:UreD-domain-containing protein [Jaminaea rosea]|uniref:UreD-domain-containing protein n=1 Tax=Jaminaea rosea TaxID=1569628 RepID=A0A316UM88_9BASI|nr:UreD-domain-containing protein [Jaminaea rosea]PWN26387.1 UreD-domain-containing protein [Jaminaea rosea]
MTEPCAPPVPPIRTQSFTGTGLAILRLTSPRSQATFTHLRSTFPLKLLHPRGSSHQATDYLRGRHAAGTGAEAGAIAALYVAGYGGGLVSGDNVRLDLDVGSGCTLLALTQGSTKVFKVRVPTRPSSHPHASPHLAAPSPPPICRQSFRYLIRPHSTLLLLPDPVTPYASSRYVQVQRFDLLCPHSSSLVALDWLTPGRTARGEQWVFGLYRSRNEVRVKGEVVLRDVVELSREQGEEEEEEEAEEEERGLAKRMAPYSVYATLILMGPAVKQSVAGLRREWARARQRGTPSGGGGGSSPPQVLWSLSPLHETSGSQEEGTPPQPPVVVRIAGHDTDSVRAWMRARLGAELGGERIGWDLWRTAMGSNEG